MKNMETEWTDFCDKALGDGLMEKMDERQTIMMKSVFYAGGLASLGVLSTGEGDLRPLMKELSDYFISMIGDK